MSQRPYGGTLLELRGDEAVVVFNSARQAIRAALELHARFREAPPTERTTLPVGIGLDAGEAAPVGAAFGEVRSISPDDSARSPPRGRRLPPRPSRTSRGAFRESPSANGRPCG
jgi:hypothetical protein